ncbi:MAG: hypothetical protein QXH24_07620 [Candidatus Bathyarchaeia archaeon]
MKRWFLAVSVVLIVIGSILINIAYIPVEAKDYKQIDKVSNRWSISVNLRKGQVIWVEIRQHINWSVGIFDFDEELYPGFAILYVSVDVTDPYGKDTEFLMVWGLSVENLGSASISKYMLTILDINVTKNEGGLDPSPFLIKKGGSSYYSDVGGVVQYNGTYTFTVEVYPSRKDPPSSIWIGQRLTWIEYPYIYMIPTGVVIDGLGATLAWFSIKKKSLKKRQIRKLRLNKYDSKK